MKPEHSVIRYPVRCKTGEPNFSAAIDLDAHRDLAMKPKYEDSMWVSAGLVVAVVLIALGGCAWAVWG